MRIKKYLCGIKKTNNTIRTVKCENYKEVRTDGARDKKGLIKI